MQTFKHAGWMSRVRSWFPEREFFMRSQGQVRFIRISTRLQMTAAAIAAGVVLVWIVAMALMIGLQFVSTSERLALLEREARVASAASRVSAYRKDVDQVAADLQRRQAFIEQVVESELGALPAQSQTAADTVSDSSTETSPM